MRRKKTKIISMILAICLMIGTLSLPVFAQNPDVNETNLTIFGLYDDDIKMSFDDSFKLKIVNTESEETREVDIQMAIATKDGVNLNLPAGTYAISDISYTGTNKEIERRGYGIISYFELDPTSNSYEELVIAVGSKSASDLQIQYYDTIQKVNGNYVDYIAEDTSDVPAIPSNPENTETESPEPEDETEFNKDQEKNNAIKEDDEIDENKNHKTNYVAKFAPLFVMCILFAAIIYKLRKKNII